MMKTNQDPSLSLGPTPKVLFKVSIAVYVLLLSGMISACLLISYPLAFQGSFAKTDTIARQQNIYFLVPKTAKLNLEDQLTFQDLSGRNFAGTVKKIYPNAEPTLVAIRVNFPQQTKTPQFNDSQIIQFKSPKRLLFVLLAKLN